MTTPRQGALGNKVVDAVGIEPTNPEGTVLQTAVAHHLLNTSVVYLLYTVSRFESQDICFGAFFGNSLVKRSVKFKEALPH